MHATTDIHNPLPRPGALTLAQASAEFLDRFRGQPHTRRAYAQTLVALEQAAVCGPSAPVEVAFTPDAAAAALARWESAAPATWNKHLAALRSFASYCARREWLTTDPTHLLERRKEPRRGDKSVPAARLEALFTDPDVRLREKVLWRMLYETAARAEEILTLDVGDLDMAMRRARVRSKGGAIEYVHWATPTARLLPRLLNGRTTGPVFCSNRRSPTAGARARALADVDPTTGRGRLSYPRAEYLFKQASKKYDPHGQGWTLHQLRHSALKHLAAEGRSAPELQAKSRHAHLATLGKYVRLGEETAARITAEHDPYNRRAPRR
ncbi:tyrosine-type recombinase/integrase [Allonocardiopsis opalescens]|uniref:tyrosine-type recombinase/integrase n=1 Tax=Allonocardiopsis opalescens TaxID=1144618 RepID=UPI001FEC5B3F|nr:tyrosine-type recombinase/integrase [Allonocardiopsis opalescens]